MSTTQPDVVKVNDLGKVSDAQYWQQAAETFNRSLKKGSASKKFIELATISSSLIARDTGIESIAAKALELYRERGLRGKKPTEHFLRLAKRLSRTKSALPPASFEVSVLVWSPLGAILESVADDLATSNLLGQGILLIVDSVDRWKTDCETFHDAPGVQRARLQLYTAVIDFLRSATVRMEKNRCQRVGGYLLGGSRSAIKFESRLSNMTKADKILGQECDSQNRAVTRNIQEDVRVLEAGVTSFYFVFFQDTSYLEHTAGTLSTLAYICGQNLWNVYRADSGLGPLPNTDTSVAATALNARFQNWTPVGEMAVDTNRATMKTMMGIVDKESENLGLTKLVSYLDPRPIDEAELAAVPGTGQWLFDHPSYRTWINGGSQNSPVLWISGAPGTGKSVLAKQLLSRPRDEDAVVASFFFHPPDGPAHMKPARLLASVLGQLLAIFASRQTILPLSCMPTLRRLLGYSPDQLRVDHSGFPFLQLWRLFEELVAGLASCTLVVIDGLDECTSSRHGPSLFSASDMASRLIELANRTSMKLAVFSRPNPAFQALIIRSFSIPLDAKLVQTDLMAVFDYEYSRMSLPTEYKATAADRVRQSAQGSFLWAIMLLRHAEMGTTKPVIRRRLDAFPRGLEHAYTEMLGDSLSLDEEQLVCRRNIFMMLLACQGPVTLGMLVSALDLPSESAETRIYSLCRPLVLVSRTRVEFCHSSVRDFLQAPGTFTITGSESHAFLARKCLLELTRGTFASLEKIAFLLRRLQTSATAGADPLPCGEDNEFYDYAAQNMATHLAAVTNPDSDLVMLAGTFLKQLQFAHWAEYLDKTKGDFSAVSKSYNKLRGWSAGLSPEDQEVLDLPNFFVVPYAALTKAYEERAAADRVLPWLTQMRLGFWHWFRNELDKATPIRERIVKGLTEILGTEHPLTLTARMDLAADYISEGRMKEANVVFAEVADLQRRLLGEGAAALWLTFIFRGQTEYYMNQFDESARTQAEASAGLLKLVGPNDSSYTGAQLWYAFAVLGQGSRDLALEVLQRVHKTRRDLFGEEDAFGVFVELSIGDILRQLGEFDKAIKILEHACKVRQDGWPPTDPLVADTVLTLAIAHRDAGHIDEASKLLDELRTKGDIKKSFVRYCQWTHLIALLHLDRGEVDAAVHIMHSLLIKTDRSKTNRALLWIRLDLADILRLQGKDYDAAALFDNIVRWKPAGEATALALVRGIQDALDGLDIIWDDDDDPEQPDSPELLRLAEEALRLVRDQKHDDARRLLAREDAEWVRVEDLWLWQGGPPADTGRMKRP